MRVEWQPRAIPLAAAAVVARGPCACRLARRVLEREDAALLRLTGVAAPRGLVMLGTPEDLPWVDGVTYLGVDNSAPSLLIPTALGPNVPLPLLERAVRRRYPSLGALLALLPDTWQVIPLEAARSVARETLAQWLEEHG
jgi:hypothetical protein